jgi:hypothetical protein
MKVFDAVQGLAFGQLRSMQSAAVAALFCCTYGSLGTAVEDALALVPVPARFSFKSDHG